MRIWANSDEKSERILAILKREYPDSVGATDLMRRLGYERKGSTSIVQKPLKTLLEYKRIEKLEDHTYRYIKEVI